MSGSSVRSFSALGNFITYHALIAQGRKSLEGSAFVVDSKKLGIYIPTYKRRDYLKTCLDSFVPHLRAGGIPIFISDDCSKDGTVEMLEGLKLQSYQNIFVNSNPENIGGGPNFIKVIEMGDTEFVWLFGDDDTITPDAIATVSRYLDEGFDFLILNSSQHGYQMKSLLADSVLPLTSDMLIEKGDHNILLDFMSKVNRTYLGFMASVITRREYLLKFIRNRALRPDSEFIQLSLFYNSIVGRRGLVVARPVVNIRVGNGRTRLLTWIYDFPESLDTLKPSYSSAILERFYRSPLQYRFVFSFIYAKAQRGLGIGKLKNSLEGRDRYVGFPAKLSMFLLALVPDGVFKVLVSRLRKIPP